MLLLTTSFLGYPLPRSHRHVDLKKKMFPSTSYSFLFQIKAVAHVVTLANKHCLAMSWNPLKFEAIFQISSPTFQKKTIGIFNLINLAFESTAALRTSILVTLPPKTFSILSSSSSSEDTCETSEAMEENILYWWILIFEGLELLSSFLGQLRYCMLSYHIMVDQRLASSMYTITVITGTPRASIHVSHLPWCIFQNGGCLKR